MSQWVNKTDISRARSVCLYDFLLTMHPEEVEREGNSLRLRCNHSVSIKTGYAGFTDFADGSAGNAIDCLTNYLDYEFQDAVVALCEFDSTTDGMTSDKISRPERPTTASKDAPASHDEMSHDATERHQEPPQAPRKVFTLPEPVQGEYRQLFAYLTKQRGIPPVLIQMLIDDGLLYQEKDHNNMVFINPEHTFAEYRGTNSSKPFHRVDFSDPEAFWWFKPRGIYTNPTVAYICEGAIDAISLYLLRATNAANCAEQGLYCAIGGVSNYKRIDRIIAGMSAAGCKAVIAVDNDKAGEICRLRYPGYEKEVPRMKDWNEDLKDVQNSTFPHAIQDVNWLSRVLLMHRKTYI